VTRSVLHELSSDSLRALAASLRQGPLATGLTDNTLHQIAGANAEHLRIFLETLLCDGWPRSALSRLALEIAEAREQRGDPSLLFELVLSGPDAPGVPTQDTAATMRALIQDAREEILLIGYAVHNARSLFLPLAERMEHIPSLRVELYLDISRTYNDTSLDSEIVRRFALEFRATHWPWPALPALYYDPRALTQGRERASLHAKCIIVDRTSALVTSANFTEAAQKRNIEVGVLMRHRSHAERLASYFHGLRAAGQLVQCHFSQ
jgi:phosphatidylserine/phosphatidylglycerophosphate/cardiolipin synthase-like enzyme